MIQLSVRSVVRVTHVALIGALVLVVSGQAHASESDDHPPTTVEDDGSNPDAELYAAEFGVSREEAERRLALQPQAGETIEALELAGGDRFAGAWLEHSPEYEIVLRMTGDQAAAAVEQIVSTSPVPIEIRSGAGRAWAELLAAQAQVDSLVREEEPEASVDIDVRNGSLVVYLPYGSHGLSEAFLNELEAGAGARVQQEVEDAPAGPGHTYGGMPLSGCSSGFTVRNYVTGVTGFVTAGHCLNGQAYYGFSESYWTDFIAEAYNSQGDLQWHTTTHIEYPRYNHNGALRTVRGTVSRAYQDVGFWVCHQGKTTGYSCGTIKSTTYRPSWSGACNGQTCQSTFIRVEGSGLKCAVGDSGGPFFSNDRARSVKHGGSTLASRNSAPAARPAGTVALIQGGWGHPTFQSPSAISALSARRGPARSRSG